MLTSCLNYLRRYLVFFFFSSAPALPDALSFIMEINFKVMTHTRRRTTTFLLLLISLALALALALASTYRYVTAPSSRDSTQLNWE